MGEEEEERGVALLPLINAMRWLHLTSVPLPPIALHCEALVRARQPRRRPSRARARRARCRRCLTLRRRLTPLLWVQTSKQQMRRLRQDDVPAERAATAAPLFRARF